MKQKKVIKNKIPTKPRKQSENKVNAIRIQQKRYTEEDKEELIDNYQYHETKDLKKDNKKTLVSHRRLCEPFYSLVHHRSSKKYSSSEVEKIKDIDNSKTIVKNKETTKLYIIFFLPSIYYICLYLYLVQ